MKELSISDDAAVIDAVRERARAQSVQLLTNMEKVKDSGLWFHIPDPQLFMREDFMVPELLALLDTDRNDFAVCVLFGLRHPEGLSRFPELFEGTDEQKMLALRTFGFLARISGDVDWYDDIDVERHLAPLKTSEALDVRAEAGHLEKLRQDGVTRPRRRVIRHELVRAKFAEEVEGLVRAGVLSHELAQSAFRELTEIVDQDDEPVEDCSELDPQERLRLFLSTAGILMDLSDPESGWVPPDHDVLVWEFGQCSRGLFAPEHVSQFEEARQLFVEFIHDGKAFRFPVEPSRDYYDTVAVHLCVHAALEVAGHVERFVYLAGDGQAVFADPAALERAREAGLVELEKS